VDATTMRKRTADARTGHLATVRPDGRPHVVVCCFALVEDHVYSAVDEKPKSTRQLQRLRNLAAHPEASLLVDHWDEDWAALWWVRLDGTARLLSRDQEQERALAALVAKYHQYVEQPPAGPVIALDISRWTAWP
jgi:PPOX class probable F420-dependent enzyme